MHFTSINNSPQIKMAKGRRVFYTMGQVCEMFDLPASTIRFWEQKFKALTPRKNAKGNRLFSATDVETLKLIYHLTKEKKMTLNGAEAYMNHKKTAAKSELSIVEILQQVRATLVEIRQEIESTEVEQKSHKSTVSSTKKTQEVIVFSEQVPDAELFDDKDSDNDTDSDSSPYTQLTLF